MKNALTSLAKSVLIPLRLPAATLGTDVALKKGFGSGVTALIMWISWYVIRYIRW